MTDEEIIKELEGAIVFAKQNKKLYLMKVADLDELIAKNTRLIEVLKKNTEFR